MVPRRVGNIGAPGLDGTAKLGGDYLFEVTNGPLRRSEARESEFATIAFQEGQANVHFQGGTLSIALPGLAPVKP